MKKVITKTVILMLLFIAIAPEARWGMHTDIFSARILAEIIENTDENSEHQDAENAIECSSSYRELFSAVICSFNYLKFLTSSAASKIFEPPR